ncbi:hypothetical protein NEOKW01_0969 [Nematocida sp. AWRm80]|nr:hypothetical protein NEOKW01_0969 [Nematocida sp. AWRm80]
MILGRDIIKPLESADNIQCLKNNNNNPPDSATALSRIKVLLSTGAGGVLKESSMKEIHDIFGFYTQYWPGIINTIQKDYLINELNTLSSGTTTAVEKEKAINTVIERIKIYIEHLQKLYIRLSRLDRNGQYIMASEYRGKNLQNLKDILYLWTITSSSNYIISLASRLRGVLGYKGLTVKEIDDLEHVSLTVDAESIKNMLNNLNLIEQPNILLKDIVLDDTISSGKSLEDNKHIRQYKTLIAIYHALIETNTITEMTEVQKNTLSPMALINLISASTATNEEYNNQTQLLKDKLDYIKEYIATNHIKGLDLPNSKTTEGQEKIDQIVQITQKALQEPQITLYQPIRNIVLDNSSNSEANNQELQNTFNQPYKSIHDYTSTVLNEVPNNGLDGFNDSPIDNSPKHHVIIDPNAEETHKKPKGTPIKQEKRHKLREENERTAWDMFIAEIGPIFILLFLIAMILLILSSNWILDQPSSLSI